MNDILDLFDEFDSNVIVVSDFGIQFRGTRVDCLVKNETYDSTPVVEIWAGNPETDKYAECLHPEKEELKLILEEILENI